MLAVQSHQPVLVNELKPPSKNTIINCFECETASCYYFSMEASASVCKNENVLKSNILTSE